MWGRITFSPVNIWFLSLLSLRFCHCTTVAPWKPQTNGTNASHVQSLQPQPVSYCQTTCHFAGLGVLLIGRNACFVGDLGLERWELRTCNMTVCKSEHVWGWMCLPLCFLGCCQFASCQLYREANGVREDAWATLLSGLQGMAPATGLHSPVCLARLAVLVLGAHVKANLALNLFSSSAMRLETCGPVPNSADPKLP